MSERAEDLKGRAKEAAGEVTGNEDLEREGKLDQASSKVKEKIEQGKDKLKDLADRDR